MAFVLEYATDQSAGRCPVEGTSVGDAIVKATTALHGLNCTRAALRHTLDPRSAFGEGSVLAVYTCAEGWNIQEAWPE